ncbi:unnamed protein product, partial [Hapterophycus canaliculatus]
MARGLTGASWALLLIHSLWFCALGLSMYKFWERRRQMKIFARWPALAFLSGFAGAAVQTTIVVQEVMAQEGKVFPCAIIIYLQPMLIGLYGVPYTLRGLRAVIISDTVWKRKYMVLLSRRSVFTALGLLFLALQGVCVVIQRVRSVTSKNPTQLCVYLGDWWVWGPLCVLLMMTASKTFLELLRLKDRIHMAKEILTTVGVWIVSSIPYYTLLVLNSYDKVDVPRQLHMTMWLGIGLTLVSTFMIEPRRRHGKVSCWRKKRVAVTIDDAKTVAWRERWHNSKVIMSNPMLDQAFEKHVKEYLCSESYDFIKEVEKYIAQAEEGLVESDFVNFRTIVDTFILAGSELEINIHTAMQKQIIEIGSRKKYFEAGTETRRDVFNASKAEILKLLDDNLIQSFWISQLFLDSCKCWQEDL